MGIKKGGKYKPNYQGCITISTNASLVKMIAPGALVILSPLVAGIFFGPAAVDGLLAGSIVSGVQVAISASNTGGAWDNCKKEIEKNNSAYKAKLKVDKICDDVKKLPELIEEEKRANPGGSARLDALLLAQTEWAKCTDLKVAAVVGDTVGDPLKDTS